MRKKCSALALLLAVLLLFTACSPAASSGAAASTATSGATTPGEGTTLTLLESLTSPQRTAIIRELCDKFEAENPGVTVNIISPPLEGADEKITQMLMSKQDIDVVEVRDWTFAQFSNNGWVASLNKYLENWEGMDTLSDTAKFYMTAYSDDVYMIPYGLFQKALFYRKDWFEEKNIPVPTTWEELTEAAIALTDTTQNRYGYSFRGGPGVNGYLDMMVWGNLGAESLASPIAAFFLKDQKTPMWSTPEAADAAKLFKRLFEEGSPKDSIAWGYPEMVQGFVGGTTAMLIQDPEVIATCSADMEDGTWGVAPLPRGTSGQALIPTGYAGWGITSYTPKADLAAALVLFLSNEENNTFFNERHNLIPTHKSAAEAPFFRDGPFAGYMEMSINTEVFQPANAPSQYQAFSKFYTEADMWVQKYLQEDITEEELLTLYNEYWTKALEDEGVLW